MTEVCNDANDIGPFTQTLFLGASIRGCTSQIGWGGTTGTLNVQLVEDKACTAGKYYYNSVGDLTSYNGEDAFMPPEVGAPVFFKVGKFEWGGLLQSWKQRAGSSGKPIYDVELTDPREILANTELIINDYNGSTYTIPNLLNVYGHAECRNGQTCSGEDPGAYGGARADESGMPWNTIKQAVQELTSSIPYNILCEGQFGGPRLYWKGHEYSVDLSEIPLAPCDYKIPGSNISLLAAIEQVCFDAGMEFFVEIIFAKTYPVAYDTDIWVASDIFPMATTTSFPGNISYEVTKIIKIRTVSKHLQPVSAGNVDYSTGMEINSRLSLGQISNFIGNGDGTVANERGLEYRSGITSNFLLGGYKSDIFQQAYSGSADGYTDTIWPYWGLGRDEAPIIGSGLNDEHSFTVPCDIIDDIDGVDSNYDLTVAELRAALAGYNSWATYLNIFRPLFAAAIALDGDGVNDFANIANKLDQGKARALALINKKRQAAILKAGKDIFHQDNLARIYNFVLSYAQNYFGRKFMVKVSAACTYQDTNCQSGTNGAFKANYIPVDSAWDESSTVLLLNNPSSALDLFTTPDGRIRAFVGFSNADSLDLGKLNVDDYYYESGFAWVKCDVETDINGKPYVFPQSGDARVVITLPAQLEVNQVDGDFPLEFGFMKLMLGQAGLNAAQLDNAKIWLIKGVGSIVNAYGYEKQCQLPLSAAIPLQSTTTSYGPWVSKTGVSGGVRFDRDDNLTPWNYGSYSAMEAVGQSMSGMALTFMTVAERGSITVPGVPTVNIGRAIQEGGPNVTNIDISVDARGGVTTTYNMRTYTPKGFSISKERLNDMQVTGRIRQKARRAMRDAVAQSNKLVKKLDKNGRPFLHGHRRDNKKKKASPHEFLVAEYFDDYDDSNRKRVAVVTEEVNLMLPDLCADDDTKYAKRAAMSMEGIFRPFTTATAATEIAHYTSPGTPKPYSKPQLPPTGVSMVNITSTNLNPFMTSSSPGDLGSSVGHDIEYITRGTTYPSDLSVYEGGYSGDARPIGLRGPLIVTGWGYDTAGRPVPNATPDNPGNTFETDWLRRPHRWKTGPVDLRWDEARGVWTPHPGFKVNIFVEVTTNLLPGSNASAKILTWNGSTYVKETQTITIYDPLYKACALAALSSEDGDRIHVVYNFDSERYEVMVEQGLHRHGTLTSTLSAGLTANFTIYKWNGSAEASAATGQTVANYHLKTGATVASGKKIQVSWDISRKVWQHINEECA